MLYILIRHGQCITNIDRKYSVASNDEDILTEEGGKQSLKTARFIKDLKIENFKLVSSPLARAKQTAQIISEEVCLNREIYYSDLLIEKSREESYSDAFIRYKSCIEECSGGNDSTIIIITHAHILQAVFANLIGLNNPEVLDFHNCSLSVYEDVKALTVNSFFHLLQQ
jgi:broad specificity phosphatase PhoE